LLQEEETREREVGRTLSGWWIQNLESGRYSELQFQGL